jgi:hypothetical protein
MQPIRKGSWLMYVSNMTSLQLISKQTEVSIRQDFLLSPQGVNVPRYWVCFSVTDAAGTYQFFHAADAMEKGCKGCRQGGRP